MKYIPLPSLSEEETEAEEEEEGEEEGEGSQEGEKEGGGEGGLFYFKGAEIKGWKEEEVGEEGKEKLFQEVLLSLGCEGGEVQKVSPPSSPSSPSPDTPSSPCSPASFYSPASPCPFPNHLLSPILLRPHLDSEEYDEKRKKTWKRKREEGKGEEEQDV